MKAVLKFIGMQDGEKSEQKKKKAGDRKIEKPELWNLRKTNKFLQFCLKLLFYFEFLQFSNQRIFFFHEIGNTKLV